MQQRAEREMFGALTDDEARQLGVFMEKLQERTR